MKILIPIDGSDEALQTLDWATRSFDPATSGFYLLTVVSKTIPELSIEEYEIEDALSILNKAKQFLSERGDRVIKAEYVIGDPAPQICDYADTIGADQIVIGSNGRTGLGKLLFGSVSAEVFEKARKPVIIHNNRKLAQKAN